MQNILYMVKIQRKLQDSFSLQEQEERTQRTPVSPPQLRMLYLSSAATYMQQVLPYLGEREKAGFFNFAIHHILLLMT